MATKPPQYQAIGNHGQKATFCTDWGIYVLPRFVRALTPSAIFVTVIILITATRSPLLVTARDILQSLFWDLVFTSLLAWAAALFNDQAQLEFSEAGVTMSSILHLRFGFGRARIIPYSSCMVRETYVWKFIDHFSLVFYRNNKAVFSISKGAYKESYADIKKEIQLRFPEGTYVFEPKEHDSAVP